MPDDFGWVDRDAYPLRSRHLDLPPSIHQQ
jgi:hypothetical protein